MKKYFVLVVVLTALVITSCKNKYEVSSQLSSEKADALLADIITYVYVRPAYANSQTRFEPRFRSYYVKQLDKFRFEKYFIGKDGTHYYYLIRPARSPLGNQRGVGGTFKINEQGKIISFKEIFNTPVASLPELQKRGDELFKQMIKHGNVKNYLKHPDYIEWPDKITYYDTLQYEWLVKPGI